jgi:tetratricopeptide (TPR) repeat protein
MGKQGVGIVLLCSLSLSCLTPTLKRNLALEYYNIGNTYFSLNKYAQAVESYQKALTYDPDLAEGNFNLARVYFALGRYEEGLDILRRLQTDRGENLILLQTIAYGLAKSGKRDEAIQYYVRVLSYSEGNTNALYNLGVLHYEMEQYEQSYIYLSRLYEIDPQDLDTLKLLGQIEVRRERFSDALQYFFPYLARKPEDLETGLAVYKILIDQKRYGEALKTLDAQLEKKKEEPRLWFEKAFVLLTKAEEKKAGIDALTKALTLGFKDPQKFRMLLVETPLSYLEEVTTVFIRTGAFSKEELDGFLKNLYEQN